MRKPRRLSPEQLAPAVWTLPEAYRGSWGTRDAGRIETKRIDWPELFQNRNPVEIEVGFGKGLFLVSSAKSNPNINYFGIEIIRKYQLYAASRIIKHQLKNAITCCGDAKPVLRDFVVPGSIQAVHVYFPDPWWKSRHKKRTLLTHEFAEIVLGVLKKYGLLHFATDVADYYDRVRGLLAEMPGFSLNAVPEESAPAHDMDYLTNFERKFRKEGRPIHRAIYAKVAP